MKNFKNSFARSPFSSSLSVVSFIIGILVLGDYAVDVLDGADPVQIKVLAVGISLMIAASIFWSRMGTVMDIYLGFAERKAEDA